MALGGVLVARPARVLEPLGRAAPAALGHAGRARTRALAARDERPAARPEAANDPSAREAAEDSALVIQFQRGDEGAFRRLVEKYQERAFWIARGMIGHDDDSRDVAQEAFVRVFKSIDRFDTKLKFYTWFYQIVVNLSIDHMRRAKHRRRVSLDDLGEGAETPRSARAREEGQAGARAVEQAETRQRVERVLAELPEKYRAVIVLRDLEGQGGKDVALVEGATHATVRWRLHRARQLFRDAWERLYGKHEGPSGSPGGQEKGS